MLGQLVALAGAHPVQPRRHPLAAAGRQAQDLQVGVHPPRVIHTAVHIKIHVRQQVDLVQQHQAGCGEHIGIFQRFVLAFGHRQDNHLGRFAEVEIGRTNQIADVFDEQNATFRQERLIQRVADAVGVEVATFAGVDLHRRNAGGADAFGVASGLLVTADHHDGKGVAQGLSGLNQQRGLAGAGAGDQIQHQHAAIREQPAVAGGELGVFRQNVLFQADPARFVSVVVNRAARVVVVGVLSLGMGMGDRLAFAATASSTHLFDLQLLDSHFVTAGQPPLVAAAERTRIVQFADRYRLSAVQAPRAARQGDDVQFRRRRDRIIAHDFEGEAQSIQFDIRQRADFQPNPPHPTEALLPGLRGNGVDDAFAKREFMHERLASRSNAYGAPGL